MRTIKYTHQFKRDYRREEKAGKYKNLSKLFLSAVKLLSSDSVLPPRYQDHSLSGNWKDHRDCHIKPDLILIYRKPNDSVLELVRLGSHSELSL